MYTYHKPLIGIQLNTVNVPLLERFYEFALEFDLAEYENGGAIESIREEAAEFFGDSRGEFRFALDIATLMEEIPDLRLRSEYHGAAKTPLWIEHVSLTKRQESVLKTHLGDFLVTPGTLKTVHELAIEMVDCVDKSTLPPHTKNVLKAHSGLLFASVSS